MDLIPFSLTNLQILTSDFSDSILYLIRRSRSRICILCYVFNCNLRSRSDRCHLIFTELCRFIARGGVVDFVFDFPRPHKPNCSSVKFFTRRFIEHSFDVRYLSSGSSLHAKLWIFDDNAAVTGSHNLTTKSVVSPYDVSLFFSDESVIFSLHEFFLSIWHKSFSP